MRFVVDGYDDSGSEVRFVEQPVGAAPFFHELFKV